MMTPAFIHLSIRIRAFEWLWIQKTIRQLELLSKCFHFFIFQSSIILPTRKKQYTVIRSPHIDKNSREQFEKRTYHALVQWNPISLNAQHSFHIMLRMLQSLSYVGVELEIRVSYSTALFSSCD